MRNTRTIADHCEYGQIYEVGNWNFRGPFHNELNADLRYYKWSFFFQLLNSVRVQDKKGNSLGIAACENRDSSVNGHFGGSLIFCPKILLSELFSKIIYIYKFQRVSMCVGQPAWELSFSRSQPDSRVFLRVLRFSSLIKIDSQLIHI